MQIFFSSAKKDNSLNRETDDVVTPPLLSILLMPIFDLFSKKKIFTRIVALSINEKCKTQFEIFAYEAFLFK